jgi:hypothetical protein
MTLQSILDGQVSAAQDLVGLRQLVDLTVLALERHYPQALLHPYKK